ncbi:hypothetical protein EauS123_00030 [Exiguobacterium phage vB_EauS-123]|nr:hypothetical protein EauS123_00030 [Exiguobacterium phage vB_EauS-123]
MTIALYVFVGMIMFFVGYVVGNRSGYSEGLYDAGEFFADAISIQVKRITDQDGSDEDETK